MNWWACRPAQWKSWLLVHFTVGGELVEPVWFPLWFPQRKIGSLLNICTRRGLFDPLLAHTFVFSCLVDTWATIVCEGNKMIGGTSRKGSTWLALVSPLENWLCNRVGGWKHFFLSPVTDSTMYKSEEMERVQQKATSILKTSNSEICTFIR